jgi:hypothetical protein
MENFPDALGERNTPLRLLLAMGFSAFFHHSFTFTARYPSTTLSLQYQNQKRNAKTPEQMRTIHMSAAHSSLILLVS